MARSTYNVGASIYNIIIALTTRRCMLCYAGACRCHVFVWYMEAVLDFMHTLYVYQYKFSD